MFIYPTSLVETFVIDIYLTTPLDSCSDETKHNIRTRTGQFLDEPDDVVGHFYSPSHHCQFAHHLFQIATANAVAVAKMARIDFPRLWYAPPRLCVFLLIHIPYKAVPW
jgi:hypothetical protein